MRRWLKPKYASRSIQTLETGVELESSQQYGSWSGAAIVSFLEQSRIPLRVALVTSKGLLIVPLWFAYRQGCFWSCSANDSMLVQSLRESPDVGLDLSTNDIPYRGVRGRGRAHCTIAPDKAALADLLGRYVARTDSELAQWLLNRGGEEAIIRFDPTWLTSWDFSECMDKVEKISSRLPGTPL